MLTKLTNSIFSRLLGNDNRFAKISDVNVVIDSLNGLTTDQTITAHAGTSQSLATALDAGINFVNATTPGDSVRLATCGAADEVSDPVADTIVKNLSVVAIYVYPDAGTKINSLAINAPYSLAAGLTARFHRYNRTNSTCTNWQTL